MPRTSASADSSDSTMSADEKKSFKATLPQDQKRVFSLLEKILEEDSTLIERVMRAPWEHTAALTCDLKKLLGDGQSNGRSEDMGKVSREMPGWEAMAWDPPLGINPSVVCFISNAQSSLRQFNMTGSIQTTPLQFPRHLWLSNGDFYDPQRPSDGLLQGEILICRVLHNVFPHLCQNDECVHYSNQRGTWMLLQALEGGIIGLAKVYNLTKVTPAFIASTTLLQPRGDFFGNLWAGSITESTNNQIRTFLEAPRFASRAKVLLDWWNKRLFGSYNMGMHTLNEGGVSTLDELDAEAEADPGLSGDERVGSSRQLDEDEEPEE
ncbi:hypothetical protein RHS01_04931 [Rhizoctonia solani]|uniref:Uncharacterized protein n=1 Tax=Rhizoctonia solani TaxID=456999 RepID=A0A8H7IC66_9AGAM|nr:hypothetical protein RHS01_04931 [Rhizoctonia solani]